MNGTKVSAHIAGGTVGVLVVWALGQFAKIVVPGEVALAMGTLVSIGLLLFFPEKVEA